MTRTSFRNKEKRASDKPKVRKEVLINDYVPEAKDNVFYALIAPMTGSVKEGGIYITHLSTNEVKLVIDIMTPDGTHIQKTFSVQEGMNEAPGIQLEKGSAIQMYFELGDEVEVQIKEIIISLTIQGK